MVSRPWLINKVRAWSITMVIILGLLPVLLLALKPLRIFLGEVFLDDAFYYLIVAQHIIDGLGSTFDGIEPTNGYHPLWMFVSMLVAEVDSQEFQIRALSFISGALYVSGAAIIAFGLFSTYRIIVRLFVFSIFSFNFFLVQIFTEGMENGISFFLFCLLLSWANKPLCDVERSDNFYLRLGIILALISLARVDYIIFALMVLGSLFFVDKWGSQNTGQQANGRLVYRYVLACTPVVGTYIAYLLINIAQFGVVWPVSGLVKNLYEREWLIDGYPNGGFIANLGYNYAQVARHTLGGIVSEFNLFFFRAFNIGLSRYVSDSFLSGLLYGIAILGGIYSVILVKRRKLSILYAVLVAYSVFQVALYAVKLPHFTVYGTWYFTSQYLIVGLMLAFGVVALWRGVVCVTGLRSANVLRAASIGGVLCLTVPATVAIYNAKIYAPGDPRVEPFHRAALWINQNLPSGARIGALSAGILSYFVKGRTVTNLDGLINSPDYYKHVLARRAFPTYLKKHIDYFADYSTNDLMATGICWEGCLPPGKLELVKKWPVSAEGDYFIIKIKH